MFVSKFLKHLAFISSLRQTIPHGSRSETLQGELNTGRMRLLRFGASVAFRIPKIRAGEFKPRARG